MIGGKEGIRMTKTMANVILMLVTIIWGGGFIATSTALDSFAPFSVMAIRFIGAAILPILIAWRKWQGMTLREVGQGVLVGIFLFLAFAFQTFGLQMTTPGKNAFLTATYVIFVPYILWLFQKRKLKRKEWIASFLCILGIALLTLRQDAFLLTLGDALSFICALFFAVHIITLERYGSHSDVFVMTALQMGTAGILSAICACLFERWPAQFSDEAILSLLYSIFIATMLAYLLQTWAQKYTDANSVSMILSMEALWASVFSFLFLQETMSPVMMIGAALILIAVLSMEYQPRKHKQVQR